jgi:membrane protease YdiL (CAAX protease family)
LNAGPASPPGSDSPGGQPRGRGAFSLEGRPAAGLYLIAWLLSGLGVGLLVVALGAGPPLGGVLLMAALLLIVGGLSAAAGHQIVARSTRPEPAYRGPSPPILFGLQLAIVNIVGVVLLVLRVPGIEDPVGFLAATILLLGGYLGVVWLFVVRSGALGWHGLGLPDHTSVMRLLGDAVFAAATMVAVAFVAALWAGLLAMLLGTQPPEVVPPTQTATGVAFVALGAGVLIPIGEELFFRGYALSAWLRDLGERAALIRSTAFFALVHILNITVPVESGDPLVGVKQATLELAVIAPVGLALGVLFLRRGLFASICGHAAYNLLGVLLLLLAHSVSPSG